MATKKNGEPGTNYGKPENRSATAVDGSKMKVRFLEEAAVGVTGGAEGIEIRLDKVHVEAIRDQKQQMIQAIGCYNNPGGPTC